MPGRLSVRATASLLEHGRLTIAVLAGILLGLGLSVGGLSRVGIPRAEASGADRPEPPVVVELFTSQSCYSCPPAEAFLGELAQRPGVIALEWHVDYWNALVYGRKGRWSDPYSHPAFTERQRRYNQALRQTNGVYTPQLVVNGRREMIGSRRQEVEQALTKVTPLPQGLRVAAQQDDTVVVTWAESPARPVSLWLVRFLERRTTAVPRGENAGKTLANHHIVTHFEPLGRLGPDDGGLAVTVRLAEDERCAILAQPAETGPIRGAAYCPGTPPAS